MITDKSTRSTSTATLRADKSKKTPPYDYVIGKLVYDDNVWLPRPSLF